MNKFLSAIAASLMGYFLLAVTVFAQTECVPIYGGGETCVQVGEITINKAVQKPQDTAFVENLNVNDPHFTPGQTVTFRLSVKNNGDQRSQKITVRDVFPQYLSFAEGPGNFDANSRTLSFDIDGLNADETRNFTVRGKVVAENQIPENQTVSCLVNQASATSNNRESVDNSQFCIERSPKTTPTPTTPDTTKGGQKIFPTPSAKETPKTGPEMLGLIALAPSGALGYWLRKKTQRN